MRARYSSAGVTARAGDGLCDDLRFFLRHANRGGFLTRVDDVLVTYRQTPGSLSFATHRREARCIVLYELTLVEEVSAASRPALTHVEAAASHVEAK